MTKPSPFRGVAVAAVARAVGTPGVQRGWAVRSRLPALLHRDRTGGVPPPPPRHPAALFRRSAVRRGPAVGRRRYLRGAAGTPAAASRRLVGCTSSAVERWNTRTLLRRLGVSLGSEASLRLPVRAGGLRVGLGGGGWNTGTPECCYVASTAQRFVGLAETALRAWRCCVGRPPSHRLLGVVVVVGGRSPVSTSAPRLFRIVAAGFRSAARAGV